MQKRERRERGSSGVVSDPWHNIVRGLCYLLFCLTQIIWSVFGLFFCLLKHISQEIKLIMIHDTITNHRFNEWAHDLIIIALSFPIHQSPSVPIIYFIIPSFFFSFYMCFFSFKNQIIPKLFQNLQPTFDYTYACTFFGKLVSKFFNLI